MKGFKNSTRTQYSMGGDVYAKGGSVKGAAKVAKVMGEFKKGDLHSGSKDGPKVTKPAQAKAIAMSEARKAGMKAPMKKGNGGDVKMPSPAESVQSGNRMAEMEAKEERFMARRAPGVGSMTEREKREMKKRVPATRREPLLPPVGESVKSGNRMSAQEAAEARAMGIYKKGGDVQKKAAGGPVQQGAATTQASRSGTTAAASTATTPRPGTTAAASTATTPRPGTTAASTATAPKKSVMQLAQEGRALASRMMSDQRARSDQARASAQQARARMYPTKGPIPTRTPPTREPMPSRKVIGYRSPPPGMSSADLANFDTRIYEPMKRGGLAVMPKGKC